MTTMAMSASAQRWGALWGDRPHAWAANEEQQTPVYEEALRRVGLGAGDRVLDVGCGTGVLPAHVRGPRRGRRRHRRGRGPARDSPASACPEADLRLGDMQTLPYADDAFDLVTGFTSFFFADDMVAALREAGRVARPGAPVVIEVFGRPEHCDLEAMKTVIRPVPAEPAGGRAGAAGAVAARRAGGDRRGGRPETAGRL